MGNLSVRLAYAKCKAREFTRNEQGDTNFISIVVILGIVLVVAGVFIAFGSDIIDWVNDNLIGNSGLNYSGNADNKLNNLKG